ncbi:MAG: ribosome biogenesis GTP-binding protein YihA/YsxC [Rikenellaceae bacterium]
MTVSNAKFLCSSAELGQCPPAEIEGNPIVEVAFIGRSNVGKSSLINMLSHQKGLAKVSSTPGKTKLINHFVMDNEWMLVDLPGYGYAKTSKKERKAFGELITAYVKGREELYCLFVLVDARLEPQRIDVEFMEMLGEEGVPFAIVFTKCDKLSKAQQSRAVEIYKKHLLKQWEEFPTYFLTSGETGLGEAELVGFIESMVSDFSQECNE